MGFGYADLERYLVRGPDGVAPALALRIERSMRASEHKRAPRRRRTSRVSARVRTGLSPD